MLFVREVRCQVTKEFPDMGALDVMKEVGRRWQNITEIDKSRFQALADKDKERFKRENQIYLKELEKIRVEMEKKFEDNPTGENEEVDYNSPQLDNQKSKSSVNNHGK
jgi:hypothetical protein